MARISCVFVFVLCLFAVEAFPKARRSKAEKAFVLYRIPASRCLDAPEDDICDFGYKVRNYNATIVSSLGKIESILSEVGVPEKCIGLITKLNCRNVYPECLSNGMLDYGDQHGLIDEIVKCAPYLTHAYKKDKFLTGIHNDPYASYHTLNCINIPQDPGKLCPKPQYSMPLTQAVDYYDKIQNASSEMAKVQPIPLECEKKAFSVLGCAHVFCSSDEKALLFKTSRGDCEEIPKCLERHNALDDGAATFFEEICPKFPSPGDYEQVDLPY